MRDLILFSPLLLLLLAIVFAKLVYHRTNSIVWASTVFTLFFSFGIAFGRLPIPLPTLIFLPIALYDLINAPPCVQTSDGCYSEADPVGTLKVFVYLFSLQWAFWTAIFVLFRYVFFTKRQ